MLNINTIFCIKYLLAVFMYLVNGTSSKLVSTYLDLTASPCHPLPVSPRLNQG